MFVSKRITNTTLDFCIPFCIGDNNRCITICHRADLLGELFTIGANTIGFLLTFSLHLTIDSLGVFLRQVSSTNAIVNQRHPKTLGLLIHALADQFDQFVTFVAHDILEGIFGNNVTQRCFHKAVQLTFRSWTETLA